MPARISLLPHQTAANLTRLLCLLCTLAIAACSSELKNIPHTLHVIEVIGDVQIAGPNQKTRPIKRGEVLLIDPGVRIDVGEDSQAFLFVEETSRVCVIGPDLESELSQLLVLTLGPTDRSVREQLKELKIAKSVSAQSYERVAAWQAGSSAADTIPSELRPTGASAAPPSASEGATEEMGAAEIGANAAKAASNAEHESASSGQKRESASSGKKKAAKTKRKEARASKKTGAREKTGARKKIGARKPTTFRKLEDHPQDTPPPRKTAPVAEKSRSFAVGSRPSVSGRGGFGGTLRDADDAAGASQSAVSPSAPAIGETKDSAKAKGQDKTKDKGEPPAKTKAKATTLTITVSGAGKRFKRKFATTAKAGVRQGVERCSEVRNLREGEKLQAKITGNAKRRKVTGVSACVEKALLDAKFKIPKGRTVVVTLRRR